jgi:hypothetical protein
MKVALGTRGKSRTFFEGKAVVLTGVIYHGNITKDRGSRVVQGQAVG